MPTSITSTDNINFTIAPQAALPPGTQMTFTISNVEDLAGNLMAAPHARSGFSVQVVDQAGNAFNGGAVNFTTQ